MTTSLCRKVWTANRGVVTAAVRHSLKAAAVKIRGMRHRVLEEGDDHHGHRDDVVNTSGDDLVYHEAVQTSGAETVNLARLLNKKIRRKEFFCSYELFPTRSEVHRRFINETQKCAPIFYALTWHEETARTGDRFPSLRCAENFPRNTLLHCTAKGLRRADVENILARALELGIVNIFALQGDAHSDDGDFAHASDLVTFIRERFGHQFSICVAGYPEMHPKSASKDEDLYYLKAKVDAGADFIITQFFFESELYIQFVNDCRKVGITVPIIPGVFPFTNAELLKKMTSICHTNIPLWMQESLQQMKGDDEAVMKFGIDLSVKIINEIRKSGIFYGYHLYALNKPFTAIEVYRQLDEPEIDEVVKIAA